MSDKDDVLYRNDIMNDIKNYQEIVDVGNPWLVEWYASTHKEHPEKIEERLNQLNREQDIMNRTGKVDENLIQDLRTLVALTKLTESLARLRAYDEEKTIDRGGYSVV